MKIFDVIIIGAGAAGLMAATQLVKRNKDILILDMGKAPARKVAISGGGKCNFTNTAANFSRYFGQNPRFVNSALAQFSPNDMLNWARTHNIEYVEKESGRYFTKNGANEIVKALLDDAQDATIKYKINVLDVTKTDDIFTVGTNQGNFVAKSVIVATGGVSYPNLGVSNIGHVIAKNVGHKIEPIRPALCAIKTAAFGSELAGISLPVSIKIGKNIINDDLLFTHFGIGGPAAYRATLFGLDNMVINFAPGADIFELLKNAKQTNGKKLVANVLAGVLPNKLAHFLANDTRNIADLRDTELRMIAERVQNVIFTDGHAVGLQSAEVTCGGVSTEKISSKTMESVLCLGLYFAGEVMDITGDLGGFNLQWAFSSGYVAGLNA